LINNFLAMKTKIMRLNWSNEDNDNEVKLEQ